MYIFEILILSLSALMLGVLVFTNIRHPKLLFGLVGILDVVLLIQIATQSLRWNFTLIYLLGLVLTLLLLYINFKSSTLAVLKIKKHIKFLSVLLLVLNALLLYAFPVPNLTVPTGLFPVGTTSYDVTDASRTEVYSESTQSGRKFMYQVWYPAEKVEKLEKALWLTDGDKVTLGLARLGHMPDFAFDQLALVTSNAYADVAVSSAQDQYPVILLSHGWSSSRLLHTNMAEALASNGYIVIGIEHTYGSIATTFTSGDVAYFSDKTLPSIEYSPDFLKNGNQLIKTFAGDISYVLDSLDDINQGTSGPALLKGKLDLDKIGIVGHSTGGGAAVLTGLHDNRIKSMLIYDPWVEPIETEELEGGLDVPTLIFRSDEWENGTNDGPLLKLIDQSTSEPKLFQVNHAQHSDFTLMYLFSPLTKDLNMLGDIDGDGLSMLQGQLDVAFFNETLLGVHDDALTKIIEEARTQDGISLDRVR